MTSISNGGDRLDPICCHGFGELVMPGHSLGAVCRRPNRQISPAPGKWGVRTGEAHLGDTDEVSEVIETLDIALPFQYVAVL